MKLLGIADKESFVDLNARIEHLGLELRKREVFSTWSVIDSAGFVTGSVRKAMIDPLAID